LTNLEENFVEPKSMDNYKLSIHSDNVGGHDILENHAQKL